MELSFDELNYLFYQLLNNLTTVNEIHFDALFDFEDCDYDKCRDLEDLELFFNKLLEKITFMRREKIRELNKKERD